MRTHTFSPRPFRPALCAGASGISTALHRPAITAPLPDTASTHNAEGAATVSAAPSKCDVFFAACVFAICMLIGLVFAAFYAGRQWLALKRVCSWCKTWQGGNPIARHTTHSICPHCLRIQKSEIARAQAQTIRANFTELPRQNVRITFTSTATNR